MAKVSTKVEVIFQLTLTLSEAEARALEAVVGYGTDVFLGCFYEHLGKHYLEPHAQGLRSLFNIVREQVPGFLVRVDLSRKAFLDKEGG